MPRILLLPPLALALAHVPPSLKAARQVSASPEPNCVAYLFAGHERLEVLFALRSPRVRLLLLCLYHLLRAE